MSDEKDGRKCKRLNTQVRTAPVHLIPGTQPIYREKAFLNKFYLVEKNTCTGIISVHLCYITLCGKDKEKEVNLPFVYLGTIT